MIAALLVLGLVIPRDTVVLVEILLIPTSERIVVEAVQVDSALLLPSAAVRDLLGVQVVGPWVSLAVLQAAYPTTVVRWNPAEGRVLIFDELSALPATRKFRDTHVLQARNAFAVPIRSGPFVAFAADERQHHVTDVGYSWRGRVAVQGRYASALGSAWAVSLAPWSKVFLSYSDGDHQPATVSGRLMAGPFWIAPTWVEGQRAGVDGLVAWRAVKLFASTRDVFALTITGRGGDLQIGRAAGRTSARLSWGPLPASPFSAPLIP